MNVAALAREIQRLDAHAIARQHQALLRLAPDGQRKHAAHAAKAVGVPFQKGVQHDFRVAVAGETMAPLLQLAAQLAMVINFAVVNQGEIAIVAVHRLLAGDEIDDGEPHRAEGDVISLENALLVGSAMNQAGGCALD